MRALDVSDPGRLAGLLQGVPEGDWIEVANEAGTFLLVRVPGGWYLPGDVVIASADIAEGEPTCVRVLQSGPTSDAADSGDAEPQSVPERDDVTPEP